MSKIEVRYFTGPSSKKPYLETLVIRYIGVYPFASGGNGDARYMHAMAVAGVDAFEPWAVIHDLSELSYEWGDMLEFVFAVGPPVAMPMGNNSATVPETERIAIIVGPKCEEGVRTLLLGEASEEPIENAGNVFRTLDAAWEYVEARIT